MKNIVFVISHLGSSSFRLFKIFDGHPFLKIKNIQARYENPLDLEPLYENSEFDHNGYYYGDHILYNSSFLCKSLYKICKFIYVVHHAKPALNMMVKNNIYGIKEANNYYCLRIRRIYEMARSTPGAVLLTGDTTTDSSLCLIQDYLELKKGLHSDLVTEEPLDLLLPSETKESEDYYEKYLYKLKQLDLKFTI